MNTIFGSFVPNQMFYFSIAMTVNSYPCVHLPCYSVPPNISYFRLWTCARHHSSPLHFHFDFFFVCVFLFAVAPTVWPNIEKSENRKHKVEIGRCRLVSTAAIDRLVALFAQILEIIFHLWQMPLYYVELEIGVGMVSECGRYSVVYISNFLHLRFHEKFVVNWFTSFYFRSNEMAHE